MTNEKPIFEIFEDIFKEFKKKHGKPEDLISKFLNLDLDMHDKPQEKYVNILFRETLEKLESEGTIKAYKHIRKTYKHLSKSVFFKEYISIAHKAFHYKNYDLVKKAIRNAIDCSFMSNKKEKYVFNELKYILHLLEQKPIIEKDINLRFKNLSTMFFRERKHRNEYLYQLMSLERLIECVKTIIFLVDTKSNISLINLLINHSQHIIAQDYRMQHSFYKTQYLDFISLSSIMGHENPRLILKKYLNSCIDAYHSIISHNFDSYKSRKSCNDLSSIYPNFLIKCQY